MGKIKYPESYLPLSEKRTGFSGRSSNWCPFFYPIPFPSVGVHTATVRFDQIKNAMVGICTEDTCTYYPGQNPFGYSIDVSGGVRHKGRIKYGITKSFRTSDANEPSVVSVIYNATEKQVSF